MSGPDGAARDSAARPRARGRRSALSVALRIAGIYAAMSVAWILLSDRAAEAVAPDAATLVWLQNVKGLAFVLVSAGVIGLLVYSHAARADTAQVRLRQSEAYFRDLFESAPTAYLSLAPDGTIEDVNVAWCELLGLTRGDALGQPLARFVAAGSQERLASQLSALVAGEVLDGAELQLRGHDGRPVTVTVDGRCQHAADGRVLAIHCILHDLTRRKEMETQLRRSRERLTQALEGGRLGAFDWDLRTGEIVWDARHAELFGVRLEDFGRTYDDFVARLHPDDLPRVQDAVAAAQREGSFYHAEFRVRDGEGGWRWVAGSGQFLFDPDGGQPVRMGGVVQDIDARKRAEADLQLHRTAVENSLYGFHINDETHRFVYANPAYLRLWGYRDLDDLRRSDPAEHCADPDQVAQVDRALAARGREVRELTARRKDGTTFPVWMAFQRLTTDDGRELTVGTSLDLTERKDLEAQLLQAQKMEAVGQLAGGVAHDFNNLLQVINGYAEMALEGLPGDDPAHACVREVVGAGGRAARLVAQLLAFSRRQVIAPQDLDLDEVVGGMLELIRRALGEVVTVQWRPGGALGNVRADRVQIEQVLMNLCLNGRDAMPEGGELVLETENVDLDADACRHHAWARPGRYVRLSVTDSGEGIAPEVAGRIWEPFFTTKEPGKGTGLGLATVYGIVQQHEGLVNVASEPGRGTRLEVYLPQVARSAAMAGPRGPVRPRGGHETVLVAEDNGNVRALMRAVLERAGYEVLVAEDGRRALDLLAEHGERVDLALLDVVMPGLGGREVRDHGRRRWPHLRYLFASGYSLDGVHTDFVLDPDVALIQKPFAAADLLAAVRAQLDGDGAPG